MRSRRSATRPGVVDGVRELLDRIADLAESITADTIREPIEELARHRPGRLRPDAGLPRRRGARRCSTTPSRGSRTSRTEPTPTQRSNRLAVARALRRLRNRLRGELVFPELDASLLGDELFRWLERTGFLGAVAKFACVARTAADAFTVGESVVELVPFTGFGAGSVGAAAAADSEEHFCWYASWLMATKGRPSWLQPDPAVARRRGLAHEGRAHRRCAGASATTCRSRPTRTTGRRRSSSGADARQQRPGATSA